MKVPIQTGGSAYPSSTPLLAQSAAAFTALPATSAAGMRGVPVGANNTHGLKVQTALQEAMRKPQSAIGLLNDIEHALGQAQTSASHQGYFSRWLASSNLFDLKGKVERTILINDKGDMTLVQASSTGREKILAPLGNVRQYLQGGEGVSFKTHKRLATLIAPDIAAQIRQAERFPSANKTSANPLVTTALAMNQVAGGRALQAVKDNGAALMQTYISTARTTQRKPAAPASQKVQPQKIAIASEKSPQTVFQAK